MIADDDSQFNEDDFVVGEPMYNEANTPQYQYPKLNEKSKPSQSISNKSNKNPYYCSETNDNYFGKWYDNKKLWYKIAHMLISNKNIPHWPNIFNKLDKVICLKFMNLITICIFC